MLFGLSVTESVMTNLGARSGTMIRWSEFCSTGKDAQGDDIYQVIFKFYESRAAYLVGDSALAVPTENKRVSITVPSGTEITETIIHTYIKTPLAGVYTLADET